VPKSFGREESAKWQRSVSWAPKSPLWVSRKEFAKKGLPPNFFFLGATLPPHRRANKNQGTPIG